jgi:transcriptional regulator with XRE-family HTH domain
MTRGELIRTERIRRGYTQEEVAAAARIKQQSYSDIEADKTASPRRTILKAISKMLDIPFESLLLGDDWREPIPEEGRIIGREYCRLSSEAKNRIMMIILQDKRDTESAEEVETRG